MNFRLYTPLFLESDVDAVLPGAGNAGGYPVYIACDDPIVAGALYSYITTNFDLSKNFTGDNFNEALEEALNQPEHRVKKCNLALAIYNRAGCLVAQMGKSRVIQVSQETGEIEYDSMAQVLDIYSSKAKVELIRIVKPGDYLLLCSAESFDAKVIRKILTDRDKDDKAKLAGIAEALKATKTSGGNKPGVVLSQVEHVQGAGGGKPLMKGFRAKYLLYLLLVAVAGAAVWLVMNNPFVGVGNDESNTVNPDSLVTTKAPNRADTTYVKPPVDTLSVENGLNVDKKPFSTDSVRRQRVAEARKKAKVEAEAARDLYDEIEEVHSAPSPARTLEEKGNAVSNPAVGEPAGGHEE